MTVLYESLEWLWSLFGVVLGEDLIWLTVPSLYLLRLRQMPSKGVCLFVRMYVQWVHRLLVQCYLYYGCYLCYWCYLYYGCYLCYWCHLCYVCCLGYCHKLSVGVSLTSVFEYCLRNLISLCSRGWSLNMMCVGEF